MMFGAELEGEAEFAEAWGSATNIIRDGAAQGVIRGVREGVAEAKRNHTFKNQSGTLEESIQGTALGWRGDKFEGVIRATAKYASFVEEGTRAHIIEPRRADALGFVGSDGNLRFARIVRHPGTKPMPFMAIAYLKAERVIIREAELGVERAQARLDR